MTIHYGVDIGVEREGDVSKSSGEASSDPSGKQFEEIMMMGHLGRSLREGDWLRIFNDPHGFRNPRLEGVEIMVLDNFQADWAGNSHGESVTYVAQRAVSQPGVEVLMRQVRSRSRWGIPETGISLSGLAIQLSQIASSENPPEVINLSFGDSPARVFEPTFKAFHKRFAEEHGSDDSRWSAATLKEFKDKLQKLAKQAVDDFNTKKGDNIETLERAVQALVDNGVTVVMSGGNDGHLAGMLRELDVDTPDEFWKSMFGQSVSADGVIVVGATDAEGQPADFSNPSGFVDVATEGVRVPVSFYGERGTGTSFAAPKVAALAADILAIRPELTPADVEAIIRESASPVAGEEESLGAGIVNPDKARELARNWVPGADSPDMTSPSISLPN